MNLIAEKMRKNDVFEILITPSREAFASTEQVSSKLFSFPEFQRKDPPTMGQTRAALPSRGHQRRLGLGYAGSWGA